MSHEIRTPMNGIIGFTELLSQSPLSEIQRSQVSLIERSARNLLGIINEVLDLSKLEAGRIVLNPHEFQLRGYLEDTVSLVAPRSPRVPVVLWIHPEVPRRLFTDPVRLQQVLNNLLTNALKSTEQGRVVVRVRDLSGTTERLLFSVSDSGTGISPRDMGSLFYPFLQLSRYAINQERGTGLGLTIARNIVERVGGNIHVASREGRGTTFWFTLPLKEGAASDLPRLLPSRTLVLVDWDRLHAEALRFQLEELGYAVEPVQDHEHWRSATVGLGSIVLLHSGSLETKSQQGTGWWLRQVYSRGATPILILETVSQRQEAYYRELGAICLSPPLRSETLKSALRVAETADGGQLEGEKAALSATETLFHDMHFLVADDNEINRMLLRAQLLKLGAEVDDARDGGEALEMLQIQPYDLVFLDLQMPVLHGLEVLDAVKKEAGPNTHTPVIAITAHAQPEQRQTVIDRGFAECLIKPILERQVIDAASEFLRLRAARQAAPSAAADAAQAVTGYSATLLNRSQGDSRVALQVARKLFAELPLQLAAIAEAFQRRERDEAARIIHKVHGSASFCGLEPLRRAAKTLESRLLENKPWDECESALAGTRGEIAALLAAEAVILDELENGQRELQRAC
jgi:two-component system sensor histidine kinase BarA